MSKSEHANPATGVTDEMIAVGLKAMGIGTEAADQLRAAYIAMRLAEPILVTDDMREDTAGAVNTPMEGDTYGEYEEEVYRAMELSKRRSLLAAQVVTRRQTIYINPPDRPDLRSQGGRTALRATLTQRFPSADFVIVFREWNDGSTGWVISGEADCGDPDKEFLLALAEEEDGAQPLIEDLAYLALVREVEGECKKFVASSQHGVIEAEAGGTPSAG